ncbi:diacylglycerol kinase family lipid kinase [Pseudonocardiaceae bacterium YIM PH 21723]|nr:diacylglycerol kinase family lipid kinase [Pseudonocardiaceae bacterium YIM PH 21723]
MSDYTAVVNPVAGRGRALRVAEQLAGLMGPAVRLERSTSLAHAEQLAAMAVERGEKVLAVGGDGLVGALAGVAVRTGGTLGIIPAGRGNDFARELGVPGTLPEQIELLGGPARQVDVLTVGERSVVCTLFCGLDSEAARLANKMRWAPPGVVYNLAAIRSLLTFDPVGYTVWIDDELVERRGFSVVICNGGFYGKGMHMAPSAKVDDGLLDVIFIREASRADLMLAMRRLYDGSHVDHPAVSVYQGRSVRLRTDRPVPVYADGDPIGEPPVEVTVNPGALTVLAGTGR